MIQKHCFKCGAALIEKELEKKEGIVPNKAYQFRISQEEMRDLFESADGRMGYNPEIADKHKKLIQEYPYFKTEKEALENAIKMIKEKPDNYQIWAKIEKGDDGIFRIQDWWLVTDDGKVKLAADYIGMALMYDNTRLGRIINNNIKIDDVVSYI